MTKPGFLTLLAATAVAASSGGAWGQAAFRYRTRLQDHMITLTDTQTGRDLIRPNGRTVTHETQIPVQMEFTSRGDGFDLELTYTNHWANPMQLGCITVPGIRFGREVTFRNLQFDAKPEVIDHENQPYAGFGYDYPSRYYSPTWVMSEGSTVLGVSLLYPVLEYNHQVTLQLCSPEGRFDDSGRNWELNIWLRDDLPPRTTRTYTLCVRVGENPGEWIRTLAPYRDYFRSTYDGLRYTADYNPISGLTLAEPGAFRSDNPRAYAVPESWRPDRFGWREICRFVKQRPRNGYARTMLWAPSGLYMNNRINNFPFNFVTPMNDFPAMRSSLNEFRSIGAAGIDVGLWWGQSTRIMRHWDTAERTIMDIRDPEHVALANAELDMAVNQLGATTIGLDAFGEGMRPRDSYEWLQTMQRRHPNVRFVTENGHADIFHALCPTFVYSHDVQTPKVLADFLLPGHETWAGIYFNVMGDRLGRPLTDAEKRAEIDRVTRLGYVAVVFNDLALDRPYKAAESWRFTIPSDLWEQDPGGAQQAQGPNHDDGDTTGGTQTGGPTGRPIGGSDAPSRPIADADSGKSGKIIGPTSPSGADTPSQPVAAPKPSRPGKVIGPTSTAPSKAKVTVKSSTVRFYGKAPAAATTATRPSADDAKQARIRAAMSRRPTAVKPATK